RRGRQAAAVARPRGPHAPELARPRRGRLLRDLLLRLGHALLSGSCPLGTRRPDADPARAGALLVLAGVGAPAAAPTPDPHGWRPGTAAAARAPVSHALRRRALRASGNARRATPAPVRRERLAQRPGQPHAARPCDGPRTRGGCAALEDRTPSLHSKE